MSEVESSQLSQDPVLPFASTQSQQPQVGDGVGEVGGEEFESNQDKTRKRKHFPAEEKEEEEEQQQHSNDNESVPKVKKEQRGGVSVQQVAVKKEKSVKDNDNEDDIEVVEDDGAVQEGSEDGKRKKRMKVSDEDDEDAVVPQVKVKVERPINDENGQTKSAEDEAQSQAEAVDEAAAADGEAVEADGDGQGEGDSSQAAGDAAPQGESGVASSSSASSSSSVGAVSSSRKKKSKKSVRQPLRGDSAYAAIPQKFRHLRACFSCHLISQGTSDYCENCKEETESTPSFRGFCALTNPSKSWVARWLRCQKRKAGAYAIMVAESQAPNARERDADEEDFGEDEER